MYYSDNPMLNLKTALAEDITAGLTAAIAAGELPTVSPVPTVTVDRPEQTEHGDFASPVALTLTKAMKKSPLDIVAAIVQHMPKKEYVGKIDVAAPGFLNIRLNPGWLTARLDNLITSDLCTDITLGQGQKLNFEFISANPTGPLTLGNARTAFSIDTLINVLNCAGFAVTREYYVNDAGEQIRKLGESVIRRALQARGEQIEYPDELYQGDYINDVAATLAEALAENEGKEFTTEDLKHEELIRTVGKQAADNILTQIKQTIRDDLRLEFDVWTSEQALRDSGTIEAILTRLRESGVTYKKDGAEYLKTTVYGDSEDRVLVKSDGEYAYITPDIAYHQDKFNRQYDEIFTIVGPDHQGHAPKLVAAMTALGNDTKRLHISASAWMRMLRDGQEVKLSKRRGNIVTPKDLIDEVGYDAARFFMVQHALTTHMDFDLSLAKEQSDRNPVYYVQYAFVRLQSILRRAKQEGIVEGVGVTVELTSHAALTHTTEIALLHQLYRFSEVITDIATSFEAQALAYYAHELARRIHVFYKHVSVLKTDNPSLLRDRLQLVTAASHVLGQTLKLLGVSQPDVM